jgi:hypothetical protein
MAKPKCKRYYISLLADSLLLFSCIDKIGVIENLSLELVKLERQNQGRNIEPSANTIDSQSIKTVRRCDSSVYSR